ncbi:MAG: DNA ligase D [Trueperaceae bacterium]
MAPLDEYRRKRNFRRSPEPSGEAHSVGDEAGGLFIIQKHAAQRLHFDLRLEKEGVLKSWAVPKGPSLDPGEKRLAVQVEDHPLEYGEFEGVIPERAYGGGTVMLWDRGRWYPNGKQSDDHLDFALEGSKLRGVWTLVRMRDSTSDDGKNWLLFRRTEEDAAKLAAGRETKPLNSSQKAKSRKAKSKNGRIEEARTEEAGGKSRAPSSLGTANGEDRSVATGRTMKQIASDRDAIWREGLPDPKALPGSRKGRLSNEPRPQLATLVDEAPQGSGWIHEIKFDGYRIMALLEGGKGGPRVRLSSRNGKDWTDRFPEIANLLQNLPVKQALLDGEMVAFAGDGSTSFRRLQESLSDENTGHLVYQAFDLLHLDGFDLAATPQLERKAALAGLLAAAGFVGSSNIRYTDHLGSKGQEFYEQACSLGLEGIISKRGDARYAGGRSKQWLKVKCTRQAELLVGGYSDPAGSRSGFGALLLGAYDHDGVLVYAGKVGTGFSERQLQQLHARLRELELDESPFEPAPPKRGVHWVRPELVVEVEFTEWTRDGSLRHPTFRGLREDREPEEIKVNSSNMDPGYAPSKTSSKKDDEAVVAGVRLSSPERVLYPEQGATKLALARYYEEIAEWILPQIENRPLSLVRCPQGREQQCFFQKHPAETMAKEIARIEIEESDGPAPYLYVRSLPDLISLVQIGVLELHVWGSRVDDIERPDILVFDLDPAPDVPWVEMLRVARELRERLQSLGLESFPRTTGGKGLHLVAPLVRKVGWDEAKAFAQGVADQHADDDRGRITTNMSKSKRRGRIFLDYLRNGRGATAIASYSTRSREDAPVAVPVRWDEVNAALRPDRYTIDNLRRRLSALKGDPWEGFGDARRAITRKMLESVGAR